MCLQRLMLLQCVHRKHKQIIVRHAKRKSAAWICTSGYVNIKRNKKRKHAFVFLETTFVPAQNQREPHQSIENTHLYFQKFHLYFSRCHGAHVRVDFSNTSANLYFCKSTKYLFSTSKNKRKRVFPVKDYIIYIGVYPREPEAQEGDVVPGARCLNGREHKVEHEQLAGESSEPSREQSNEHSEQRDESNQRAAASKHSSEHSSEHSSTNTASSSEQQREAASSSEQKRAQQRARQQ